jgi:Zn-dependent protease/CBS domain-containing protein
MNGSLRLGRIRGIDIAVHPSLALAFFLIVWTLSRYWLPEFLPGRSQTLYWALAVAGALGLFLSVLTHELGHSITAQERGIRVTSITLFVFGGIAGLAAEPETSRDEFWITVVGPLTSLVLAALSGAVWYATRDTLPTLAALGLVLGFINLQLALFNLIPGFPLDGGRILRSIIWAITGNLLRATRIATLIGQVVGYAFIVWGAYRILVAHDFVSGLWTAFIGWFLQNAAEGTYRQVQAEYPFRAARVGDVMTPPPPTVAPGLSVARLVDDYILGRRLRAVPVAEGDRLLGLVTIADIAEIPRAAWPTTSVAQAITGAGLPRTVHATDSLTMALRLLGEGQFHQLPVVDVAGHLIGLLSYADVIRYLQLHPA